MAKRSGSSRNSTFPLTATPVTVIAHLMGIAAIVLVLVWNLHFRPGLALRSVTKEKILNVHVVLMVVGFIFMAGEGVMAYTTVPAKRRVQKIVHTVFHLIALIVGIVGVYATFKFHREVGLRDMYSFHSWVGMGAICLFGLQWLFGFFSFMYPRTHSSTRSRFRPWHVFMGITIFLLAILAAETGLVQRFQSLGLSRSKEAYVVNFTGVAILFFATAVVFSTFLPQT